MEQPADTKKGKNLRMYSHFWSEGGGYWYANKADKAGMREWLRGPKVGAWWAAIADTGQKHILPWVRVNPDGRLASGDIAGEGFVRFEEREIYIARSMWAEVDDLTALLTLGVTKQEIETGEYGHRAYLLAGDRLLECDAVYGRQRGCGIFALALWLAQREEPDGTETQGGSAGLHGGTYPGVPL
ncbi:MAG: hypothetical protein ACREU7_09055, partial [Burkholderiales bacterium]